MKMKGVWSVFFLAIVTLLVFQAAWLHNTYNTKKNDIGKQINILLSQSVKNETLHRIVKEELFKGMLHKKEENIEILPDDKIYELDDKESIEAGVYQQLLEHSGFSFNINTLDSIFNRELQKADIPTNYLLYYKDSTGHIIKQTGNLLSSKIEKAFKTDPLLIVNGKRVQAIINISYSTIFKQMAGLLIASLLMLIIIMFCVIYQAKTIFNQYKLKQLREDFMHALTHDMKTPLGSINTILSQFRSGSLDDKPEMKERFGRIAMDQVANLLLLVERILTIARTEQGKLIPERVNTDMHAIINSLKDRFLVMNDKQVTITSSIKTDENQTIEIDSSLIKNAIGNLIENAIKYSGDSVSILINCYVKDDKLFIRVTDDGFGISEKERKKIFEKFERGTAIRRKGASGFGLGLNYVKQVTEAHGGIVTIFSTEGEGSEFSLVIPLD